MMPPPALSQTRYLRMPHLRKIDFIEIAVPVAVTPKS